MASLKLPAPVCNSLNDFSNWLSSKLSSSANFFSSLLISNLWVSSTFFSYRRGYDIAWGPILLQLISKFPRCAVNKAGWLMLCQALPRMVVLCARWQALYAELPPWQQVVWCLTIHHIENPGEGGYSVAEILDLNFLRKCQAAYNMWNCKLNWSIQTRSCKQINNNTIVLLITFPYKKASESLLLDWLSIKQAY